MHQQRGWPGRLLRIGSWLVLTGALGVANGIPAFAAIDATLSSSRARPGDPVVLTADDYGNPKSKETWLRDNGPLPNYLVGITDFQREIARYGGQRCGTQEQHYLGRLTWLRGSGSASFRVPSVPKGDYYFQVAVPNSTPSCWRITTRAGVLTLSVTERGSLARRHLVSGWWLAAGFGISLCAIAVGARLWVARTHR